ncbi:DsbA family protein [Agromyces seonyuensis]|uniref:Thioredoxin domain-containing protein n=1 Tax=Agromyces seonyuensis TaxID=2662446 RepID=A0A6I4P3D1_9MICO|nr:thioredoxin domain-containing protein [Agromyces seonyuensis]MWB97724.1 thioredoxin domain-containing protein [Agromyces seonyuensis]
MTYGGSNQPRPTRNDRRDAAREKARQLREDQKKRDRRQRWLLQGGVAVVVVVAIAIVSLVVMNSITPAKPGPQNMASDGILLVQGEDGASISAVRTGGVPADGEPVPTVPDASGDVANIVIYVDYLCANCGDFEAANGELLQTMVTSGFATLEIHPLGMLKTLSQGTQYSVRAANAAACVADASPDDFFAYHQALFAQQPEENTPGLTDEELADLASDTGVGSLDAVTTCITDREFTTWVGQATERALDGPLPNTEVENVQGTPTVLVNGLQYTGANDDSDEFRSFVQQALSTAAEKATPTPTPTPGG